MSSRTEREIMQRIELSGNASKIDHLNLDDVNIRYFTASTKALLEKCSSLEYLCLNSCDLTSLENFPKLPKLIALELSNNKLNGNDLAILGQCPLLSFLSLDDNQIASLQSLKSLTSLRQLEILHVERNPLCDDPEYINKIFSYFSLLNNVDWTDRFGNKIDQDEDYITNKFRSATDLMDFLQDDPQDLQKTDIGYQSEESPEINGKNKQIPFRLINIPKMNPVRHSNILFMRTGLSGSLDEESDSDQDDLVSHFHKMQKKQ